MKAREKKADNERAMAGRLAETLKVMSEIRGILSEANLRGTEICSRLVDVDKAIMPLDKDQASLLKAILNNLTQLKKTPTAHKNNVSKVNKTVKSYSDLLSRMKIAREAGFFKVEVDFTFLSSVESKILACIGRMGSLNELHSKDLKEFETIFLGHVETFKKNLAFIKKAEQSRQSSINGIVTSIASISNIIEPLEDYVVEHSDLLEQNHDLPIQTAVATSTATSSELKALFTSQIDVDKLVRAKLGVGIDTISNSLFNSPVAGRPAIEARQHAMPVFGQG
jgi:hypothetical protein